MNRIISISFELEQVEFGMLIPSISLLEKSQKEFGRLPILFVCFSFRFVNLAVLTKSSLSILLQEAIHAKVDRRERKY